MDERPDKVVIVGGGISGLTAGILLASRGVNVVLVEQHAVLGGYLQGFSRRGVRFETGLHYMGACLPGQTFARYFSLLGVYDDLTFLTSPKNILGNVLLPGGRRLTVPHGFDALADAAKQAFPHEQAGVDGLMREMRDCLQAMAWLELRERDVNLDIYNTYITRSVDAVIRAHLSNPELVAFFSSLCFSTAMLPTECPFAIYASITRSLLHSCCTVKGGGRELVAVLQRRFESLGGRVIVGNGARSVAFDEKRLSALELDDGTLLDLDLLISTCHPCETVRFIGRDRFSPSFLENLDSLEMSNGCFKVYLELDKPVEALGQDRYVICTPEWPCGLYTASPSALDPSYGDKHCLDILAWQNFSEVERWQPSRRGRRPGEYEDFKKQTAQRLLDRVAREFPELPSRVRHCYTSSPLTNLDYVRSARGGAMGIKQDITQQGKRHIRPRNKLRNLFMAGQSVSFPGILGSVVGATELCDAILGEDVDLFRDLQAVTFR